MNSLCSTNIPRQEYVRNLENILQSELYTKIELSLGRYGDEKLTTQKDDSSMHAIDESDLTSFESITVYSLREM